MKIVIRGGKPSIAQAFSKKFSRKATQSPHFKPAALARAIAGVFVCGALAGASGQARCDEPPIEEEYLNDIGATVLLEGGATENAYGLEAFATDLFGIVENLGELIIRGGSGNAAHGIKNLMLAGDIYNGIRRYGSPVTADANIVIQGGVGDESYGMGSIASRDSFTTQNYGTINITGGQGTHAVGIQYVLDNTSYESRIHNYAELHASDVYGITIAGGKGEKAFGIDSVANGRGSVLKIIGDGGVLIQGSAETQSVYGINVVSNNAGVVDIEIVECSR